MEYSTIILVIFASAFFLRFFPRFVSS